MKQIQAWIERVLVPIVNKITSNFWCGIVADAILYIVPFSMVSAIPSIWTIIRNFVPALPDISAISTYSFGLIGLFVVFIIPYNCLNKIDKKDRSLIAGFTGIGTYMMCMNFQAVDGGSLVDLSKFGAGGMFTAMFVGLLVAVVYKLMAKYSFFGEDSVIPDFVKNWFDNIIAILISLFLGYLLTFVLKIDVFTMVQLIMKPVTSFAQSAPGVVLIVFLQNIFYFFGISGWVFTPVTRTITQAAIAENAAMVAAGMQPKNIYAYGFSRYHHIGGQGATLPLAFFMLRAKSRRYRLLGKATASVWRRSGQPLYVHSHCADRHHSAGFLLLLVPVWLGHHQLRQLRHELRPQCSLGLLHVGRRFPQRHSGLHQLCDRCPDLVPLLQGIRQRRIQERTGT